MSEILYKALVGGLTAGIYFIFLGIVRSFRNKDKNKDNKEQKKPESSFADFKRLAQKNEFHDPDIDEQEVSDLYDDEAAEESEEDGDDNEELIKKEPDGQNGEGTTTKKIKDESEKPSEYSLNFCKYCGAPLDEDSLFCSHCGRSLSKKEE